MAGDTPRRNHVLSDVAQSSYLRLSKHKTVPDHRSPSREMLLYGLLHRRQDGASPEGERRLIVRCHRYFPASPATLEHTSVAARRPIPIRRYFRRIKNSATAWSSGRASADQVVDQGETNEPIVSDELRMELVPPLSNSYQARDKRTDHLNQPRRIRLQRSQIQRNRADTAELEFSMTLLWLEGIFSKVTLLIISAFMWTRFYFMDYDYEQADDERASGGFEPAAK